jgi:c-di-GMP-binding flagellar brake protein YcgR
MSEGEFLHGSFSDSLKKFLDDGGSRPPRASDGTPVVPARPAQGRERRRFARFKVSPMYSRIVVQRIEGDTALMDRHIYDISEGGLRFELDEPLADGERVTVEVSLPGCQKLIRASGKVVRVNDADDDPGPRRMALRFEAFADDASRVALARYLDQGWLEQERAA